MLLSYVVGEVGPTLERWRCAEVSEEKDIEITTATSTRMKVYSVSSSLLISWL